MLCDAVKIDTALGDMKVNKKGDFGLIDRLLPDLFIIKLKLK
jgi:hypothetical protein